jgi:hypothetical protein
MSNNNPTYNISSGYNYDLFFDDTIDTCTSGVAGPASTGAGVYWTPNSGGAGAGGYRTPNSVGTGAGILTTTGNTTVWATHPGVSNDAIKELKAAIKNIEERLAILHPNPELEDRWNELKALGERYRELEKDIMSKEKMWDILKK